MILLTAGGQMTHELSNVHIPGPAQRSRQPPLVNVIEEWKDVPALSNGAGVTLP